jgi:hypothetical protein
MTSTFSKKRGTEGERDSSDWATTFQSPAWAALRTLGSNRLHGFPQSPSSGVVKSDAPPLRRTNLGKDAQHAPRGGGQDLEGVGILHLVHRLRAFHAFGEFAALRRQHGVDHVIGQGATLQHALQASLEEFLDRGGDLLIGGGAITVQRLPDELPQ